MTDEDSVVNASVKENKFRDQNSPSGILNTELPGIEYKTKTPSLYANAPNFNHSVLGPEISAVANGWY